MIEINHIRNFFPAQIRNKSLFDRYMLKEYIQLMVLEYLSGSKYLSQIAFIGGTNLRLVKGIDRFSEDLDFDCTGMEESVFYQMSEEVVSFLARSGFRVEEKKPGRGKLNAFRSSLYFPELLFELGLSGHREQRFLIKIEAEDQNFAYDPRMVSIHGCGMFFPFPVPADDLLCAMKISALLNRHKGRDFYDVMFLMAQTPPDYGFLAEKNNIHNSNELKKAMTDIFQTVNIKQKQKDFEHLLFNPANSKRILEFNAFIESVL
jgi:predicted nucleotidyltransferase component of viral defense system